MTSFEPIAIVGVGMRAPGGIKDLASLWDTIIQGKSHDSRLATDPRFLRRFNSEDFKAMFSVTPDARATLHGNLLDETPGLDEAYFNVTKRQSAHMDVQQKLLLHVAHEALEDAGFSGCADGSALDPATFGVYVGSSTDDFFMDPNSYPIDIYHLVSNQRAFLSGQISHHFGLHGPSVSMDTVCASSLTAFNDACRALATGECRAAIAGGVHVMSPISSPPTVMSLKLAGFLDPNGQCKPFLAGAGGYCRAEGCGLAVLKRLSDAVRDGDRIHGVIRGMGVGNMAKAESIIRPDGHLQSLALGRAVSASGINPTDITFVEAHGPGTQQGDPAELHSICTVLAPPDRKETLIIGSVKCNVGHSEAASGAISLFKVLAMMQHQRIPPQANFHPSDLNPRLKPFVDQYPIKISDQECEWNAPRRIAVVSNFGASGYAGHMVVEAPYFDNSPIPLQHKYIPLPFMISANDRSVLSTLARNYADWLDHEVTHIRLNDISYATTVRRVPHRYFIPLQANSIPDLALKLHNEDMQIVDSSETSPRTLGFCFSGQGGPRLDPRQSSLYGVSIAFSSVVDACFSLSESEQLVAPEDIDILELFALQAGLAEMWTAWGISPVAYAGHSFGEYLSLVRAGVLSLRDALMLLGIRGSLVRTKCTGSQSRMAALRLSLPLVYDLLNQQQTARVELACINSEDRVTLAGKQEDLEQFKEEVLKAYPTAKWQLLDSMRTAFHSRFMKPLLPDFLHACEAVSFHPPKACLLSSTLGRVCFPGDDVVLQSDYLARHCSETNKFGVAITDYKKRNEAAGLAQPDWIELGPHSTTVGFIPVHSGQLKLSSHRKGGDGWDTSLESLLTLCAAGHKIDWAAVQRDINPHASHVNLPRYPLKQQPHYYPVRKTIESLPKAFDQFIRVTSSEISALITSHVVANKVICPASVYLALALAAVDRKTENNCTAFRLSHVVMTTPYTNPDDSWLEAQVSLPLSQRDVPFACKVISKSLQVHATLQVELCEETRLFDTINLLKHFVLSSRSIKHLPGTNVIDKRLAYDLFSQTVRYGSHLQGLRRVWISEDGRQSWALSSNDAMETEERSTLEPTVLQNFSPILIDRACQLVGLLINTSDTRAPDEIFVATEIDEVEISFSKIQGSLFFESYASFDLVTISHGAENAMALGQVFTFDQNQNLVAVFRGVRMRRMKLRLVEMLVQKSSTMAINTPPKTNSEPVDVLPSPPHSPIRTPIRMDETLCQQISSVIQTTLGLGKISTDKKLVDLGVDSLTAVEIGIELGRQLPGHHIPNELLVNPTTTLKSLVETLGISSAVQTHAGTVEPEPQSVVDRTPALTTGALAVLDRINDKPEVIRYRAGTIPLVLIHDGGGTTLAYHLLGDVGCTILGIHCPGLREGKGITSVRDAADQYASLIHRQLQQSSNSFPKVYVGGWSLGGTIAITLAAAHPDIVSGVILLDPPPPGTAAMKPEEVERLTRCANDMPLGGFSSLVKTQLKMNAISLNADIERRGGMRPLLTQLRVPVCLISASQPSSDSAGVRDAIPPRSCSAWMFSQDRAEIAEVAWKEILDGLLIDTQRVPADHFTMFSPALAVHTTRAVQHALSSLEGYRFRSWS